MMLVWRKLVLLLRQTDLNNIQPRMDLLFSQTDLVLYWDFIITQ